MGMGTRESQKSQEDIWIANGELARSPGHPFFQRLNELLESEKFDEFVGGLCRKFYAVSSSTEKWLSVTFGDTSRRDEIRLRKTQFWQSSGLNHGKANSGSRPG